MESLRAMFPNHRSETVFNAFSRARGDMDVAVNILLETPPDAVVQPRRFLPSESFLRIPSGLAYSHQVVSHQAAPVSFEKNLVDANASNASRWNSLKSLM